jgi:hypothetical protein
MFDVLRSDRYMTAHGLEPRTPFLDKELVNYVYNNVPIAYLRSSDMQIEKQILRQAFFDYLPKEIIERKKEAFSDGVININSKPWYKSFNEKECYLDIFRKHCPNNENIIKHYWMPNWSPETKDPLTWPGKVNLILDDLKVVSDGQASVLSFFRLRDGLLGFYRPKGSTY